MTSFRFDHARAFVGPLLLWGITPHSGVVTVADDGLRVRCGPWTLETPLDNIVTAEVTGPYRWWRAIGIRMSLADRGVTFGTTAAAGVCISLRDAVSVRIGPVVVPLHHPGVTVTVADPDALVRALAR